MYITKYFTSLKNKIEKIEKKKIEELSRVFAKYKKNKNNIFIFGNGGSASIASHVATDLNKICKISSRNFNEANHITCYSNDFGYEKWIEETLKVYAKKKDLIILISSSGKSKNMINAAKYCIKKKIRLISLTGFSRKNLLYTLNKKESLNFWVDSKNYNIVENLHQMILLSAIDNLINLKF